VGRKYGFGVDDPRGEGPKKEAKEEQTQGGTEMEQVVSLVDRDRGGDGSDAKRHQLIRGTVTKEREGREKEEKIKLAKEKMVRSAVEDVCKWLGKVMTT
jgi:hypothetical protein